MANNTSTPTKILQKLIDSSGKTRAEIAKAIGCDTSTITKHYSGVRQMNAEHIVMYARYFKVSADYMLGLEKEPTKEPPSQGQAVSEDNGCTNSERYNVRTLCELLDLQEDKQFTILELLGYAEHTISQLSSDKEALLASQGVLHRHISDLEKKNSELDKALDEFYD